MRSKLIKSDPAAAAESIATELNITPAEATAQMAGLEFLTAAEQVGPDYLGGGLSANLLAAAKFNQTLGRDRLGAARRRLHRGGRRPVRQVRHRVSTRTVTGRADGGAGVVDAPALQFVDVQQTYASTTGEPVVALDGIDLGRRGRFAGDARRPERLRQVHPGAARRRVHARRAAGEVLSFGAEVRRPGAARGVVFQQPTSLLPWYSVRKNVELGLRYRGVASRTDRRARAEVELARVGLTDFADRAVYELSGGMQQRTQIARVLANDPEVMLMDEPFGALDALTRERLQGELLGIWRTMRPTVLLITHSVEEAVALGTRVIVMSSRPGRIVLDEAQPFAAREETIDDIRADAEFVAACQLVRAALDGATT